MEYKKGVNGMSINSYDNYQLSWRPDRNLLKRPLYRSLIQLLEEDILSGKLQRNTRLPSQRELADFLDINFTTVGQAYKYGVEKGLLYTNIGSGTYISQNAFQSITISNNDVGTNIIDLGLVSSFEECNDLVIPYIQKVSQQTSIYSLLNYQDPMGSLSQRTVASEWLNTQGVVCSPDLVALTSGVQNGMAITLTSIFSQGDRIAVDRYTYANFIELAKLLGIEIVLIDYDDEGMLAEQLEIECVKKKIHGAFLMPSCNNPVGFQMSEVRKKELAEVFKKHDILIIEDDIHAFLTTPFLSKAARPFQALLPDQTIYLAGMTKYICSGLRIAYLVYPEKLRNKIQKSIFNINVKSSGFDAEVITQILHSPTAEEILNKKYQLTKQANQLFLELFPEISGGHPAPFYRCIPVSTQFSQQEIEHYFLEEGVRVYHSNRFTIQKQEDPFIRVALSSNNLELLMQGLEKVHKRVKRFQ